MDRKEKTKEKSIISNTKAYNADWQVSPHQSRWSTEKTKPEEWHNL